MAWQLAAVNDLVRSKAVSSGELSINGLSGSKRGGRGMLDVLILKLDVLDELLANMAPMGWSADVQSRIRSTFNSHQSYRATLGADDADMTWMGVLPVSAQNFVRLIEDTCSSQSCKLHGCQTHSDCHRTSSSP